MRLIFKPRARVRERFPSRVGFDSFGVTSAAVFAVSAFEFVAFTGATVLPVAFAPFLLSAGFTAIVSGVAAASFVSVLSGRTFTDADSAGEAAGAGETAAGGASGIFLAVAVAFDFTSITRRYGFASRYALASRAPSTSRTTRTTPSLF